VLGDPTDDRPEPIMGGAKLADRRAMFEDDGGHELVRMRLLTDICVRAPGTAFVGRTLLFAGPTLECPGK